MRLLNIYTLELTVFDGEDTVPPYLIASHRWQQDEATYKDVLKKRNKHTKGYKKIESFCQLAASKKIRDTISCDWIWIDTCCIDKDSSADVSEAVNSMWMYYRQAVCCLAWLPDIYSMLGTERLVMREFEKSEWFKRGWTLQELIAPRMVVFLKADWAVVGHKYTLAIEPSKVSLEFGPALNECISRVTNIESQILCNPEACDRITVAERLEWAGHRITTKPEDLAYCLLGLCNIHMPLIYGEGQASAFKRLREQIIHHTAAAPTYPYAASATRPCSAPSPTSSHGSGAAAAGRNEPPESASPSAVPRSVHNPDKIISNSSTAQSFQTVPAGRGPPNAIRDSATPMTDMPPTSSQPRYLVHWNHIWSDYKASESRPWSEPPASSIYSTEGSTGYTHSSGASLTSDVAHSHATHSDDDEDSAGDNTKKDTAKRRDARSQRKKDSNPSSKQTPRVNGPPRAKLEMYVSSNTPTDASAGP